MTTATIIMYVTVVVALAFDVINGFHDAANAIATIVSTRVLTPRVAVIWAAVFNFVALFLFHEGVAKTVAGLVTLEPGDPAFSFVVLAGLLGAIFWNLLTWWWGLPSSSSHALMGGFSGAGLAYGGWKVLKLEKLTLAAQFIVLSPVMGFMLGGLFLLALAWVFRRWRPARVDRTFRVGQLMSAAAYSIGHGANDAQKTMGIIIAALVAGGQLAPDSNDTPGWIAPACYACMALGTSMGGWRIVRTMGSKLVHLQPFGGFCAELAGACTLFIATHFKIPVSTTHTITGAILGVGSTTRLRGVRWGLASRIIWAWVFTIPAAASVSALCLWVFHQAGFY